VTTDDDDDWETKRTQSQVFEKVKEREEEEVLRARL